MLKGLPKYEISLQTINQDGSEQDNAVDVETTHRAMHQLYTEGQSIRVYNAAKDRCRKAVIACVNNDNTYDLIDEDNVSNDRIIDIEPFEKENITATSDDVTNVVKYKEYGNALFTRKDYDSAVDYYMKSLQILNNNCPTITTGSTVLVQYNNTGRYKVGMVSFVHGTGSSSSSSSSSRSISSTGGDNDNLFDIMYNSDASDGTAAVDEEEEEEEVSRDRLTAIHPLKVMIENESALIMQIILHLNLSKSFLKLNKPGWSCRYASFVITVIQQYVDNPTVGAMQKKKVDALICRYRSFIQTGRLGFARKDAQLLNVYDSVKSIQLIKEVDQLRNKKIRDNKVLAKEISNWVSTSMSVNEKILNDRKQLHNRSSCSNNDGDDIVMEEDDDDTDEAAAAAAEHKGLSTGDIQEDKEGCIVV